MFEGAAYRMRANVPPQRVLVGASCCSETVAGGRRDAGVALLRLRGLGLVFEPLGLRILSQSLLGTLFLFLSSCARRKGRSGLGRHVLRASCLLLPIHQVLQRCKTGGTALHIKAIRSETSQCSFA